jgi:hypothetical protein
MSTPPVELPSRPESARVKSTASLGNESTGFQPAPHISRRDFKNRRRPRAAHKIVQKPQDSPEDPVFTHFRKIAEKKEDASCVFLLWSSENSESSTTWAVDVPTTNIESEDRIFTLLAKRYATERGFLRSYLSFRKFSRLKPVTVRYNQLIVCLSILTLSIVSVHLSFLGKVPSFHRTYKRGQLSQDLL